MSQPDCNRDSLVCPAITWAEKEIARLRAEVGRLRLEVGQCATELEEAAKLLGGHGLKGMQSIYDAAARRAKAAAIEFVYEQKQNTGE